LSGFSRSASRIFSRSFSIDRLLWRSTVWHERGIL
jgi:hypothetical protein